MKPSEAKGHDVVLRRAQVRLKEIPQFRAGESKAPATAIRNNDPCKSGPDALPELTPRQVDLSGDSLREDENQHKLQNCITRLSNSGVLMGQHKNVASHDYPNISEHIAKSASKQQTGANVWRCR